MTWRRLLAVATLFALIAGARSDAGAAPLAAPRARLAIVEMRLDDAAKILEGEGDSPDEAIARARLELYRGRCDEAVATIHRPDLEHDDEAAHLYAVARGCARGTAATTTMRDDALGVQVRFQDDADRPLFPLIARSAAAMRDALARDLGTRLPDPIRIELVRDQFTLAALSGLSEEAARTTGTVAVAKWGRVLMISPRAARGGYRWLDTLAHELTHLTISQATRDRAPLWLQEGLAKREEIRWREPTPFDGKPSADAVAWSGIQRGLGLELTKLGPSIAMLPSPEHARVAFAEVSSFVDFWVAKNGPEALPKLLGAIKSGLPGASASDALKKVSGKDLGAWDKLWRRHLSSAKPAPRDHHDLEPAKQRQLSRKRRVAQLLLGRGHAHAAERAASEAHAIAPREPSVRCLVADALVGMGDTTGAIGLVENPADVEHDSARWWSLHEAFLGPEALPNAREFAWSAPLDRRMACSELPFGEHPADPLARAVCEMALTRPLPVGR